MADFDILCATCLPLSSYEEPDDFVVATGVAPNALIGGAPFVGWRARRGEPQAGQRFAAALRNGSMPLAIG